MDDGPLILVCSLAMLVMVYFGDKKGHPMEKWSKKNPKLYFSLILGIPLLFVIVIKING